MYLQSKIFDEAVELTNFVNSTLDSSDQIQQILFVDKPFPHFVLFYWK
mgnify:CR=1 FL=1